MFYFCNSVSTRLGIFDLLVTCRLLQVVLLSATMPAEVLEVTMHEPIRILVKKEELTLEGIKQFYINVEREVGYLQNYTVLTMKWPLL